MSQIVIVVGTYTGGLIGLEGPASNLSTIFAFSATTVNPTTELYQIPQNTGKYSDCWWIR